MADDASGKSIRDAYRNWTDDATVAPADSQPSAGASIRDAYRTAPEGTASAPPPPTVTFPTTVAAMRNALKPEAGYTRLPGLAAMLPLAWRETTPGSGQIDTSKPSWSDVRWDPGATVSALGGNALLDLLEGTGLATSVGGPNAPLAGKVSPEATAFILGTRMMMRPRNALEFGPPEAMPPSAGDLRRAPLPPEFTTNPLTPEAKATVAAQTSVPNAPATQTGVPIVRGTPASGVVPTTSAAARDVASAYYKTFDQAVQDGGSMTPQATNKFIASVEAAAPKPGIGQAVAGKNAITDLVERLQPYKDKPMSLQDVQDVDRQIGNLVSAEYGKTGVSDIGRQLQGIQHGFREQTANPAAGDVVSGQAGLDALAPARKAYSQAQKLDTIERIQERANMTDNPETSVRTQIRNLLTNDRMSRGFTDEEKAALRDAANRGTIATALHIMGSRLVPIIAGGVGSAGGFTGAVAGAVAGHVLNEAARAGESALARRRMGNALTEIGRGVPPPP